MLTITERLTEPQPAQATLTLPFETRQKSRFKARLDNGEEVGIFLERGKVLRSGDLLRAENGIVIQLIAADEAVSTVECNDPLLLSRLCYHLGNRHIPLKIDKNRVQYLQDHVLDDMVHSFGVHVTHESTGFDPETGAYQTHAHAHD